MTTHNSSMYSIYALIDPRDSKVRYVGQTIDVYARFQQHLKGGGNFTKTAWILELRAVNRMVIMETLEEVETYQEAIEREAYWIRHFEMLEVPLFNVAHRSSLKRVKKNQTKIARQSAARALLAMENAKEKREAVPPPPVIPKKEVVLLHKEAIISAMNALKGEGRALTISAIAKKAGLSWRQFDEIQIIADDDGYVLVDAKGRPLSEWMQGAGRKPGR